MPDWDGNNGSRTSIILAATQSQSFQAEVTILKDRPIANMTAEEVPIPGTVHLIDLEGTMQATHGSGENRDTILIPAPTVSVPRHKLHFLQEETSWLTLFFWYAKGRPQRPSDMVSPTQVAGTVMHDRIYDGGGSLHCSHVFGLR